MLNVLRLVILWATCLASLSFAQPTPAGTNIENVALVAFDEFQPNSSSYLSRSYGTLPVVTKVITAVCEPEVLPNGTLTAPGQSVPATLGGQVILTYTVRNATSTYRIFNLTAAQEGTVAWQPSKKAFYVDANLDGKVSAGETEVASVRVEAGATAQVLLVADVPANASGGSAFLNVSAGCSDTASGVDNNNVAQITLPNAPAISLTKSASPSVVNVGSTVKFTLTAINTGPVGLKNLMFTDDLTQADLDGFEYVEGSAKIVNPANPTGYSWSITTGSIKLLSTTATLPVNGIITIEFSLRTLANVTVGTKNNKATISAESVLDATQKVSTESAAPFSVISNPLIYLGPQGKPRAAELSVDDTQGYTVLIRGQRSCLFHTVENASLITDSVTIAAEEIGSSVTMSLIDTQGNPLENPVVLAAGTSKDFYACYVVTSGLLSFNETIKLVATSARGAIANRTLDVLTANSAGDVVLTKLQSVPSNQYTAAGSEVTYTLRVKNNSVANITSMTITDNLDANVQYVTDSASPAVASVTPVGSKTSLKWELKTPLAPNAERDITFKAKILSTVVDGTVIPNTFSLNYSADGGSTGGGTSNEVKLKVWNSSLFLKKEVDRNTADIGDTLTWKITLSNGSTLRSVSFPEIVDSLPEGLQYIAGSSLLNAKELKDPTISGNTLTWSSLPTLDARPEDTTKDAKAVYSYVITFKTRVTAAAKTNLNNIANARACGDDSVAGSVVSLAVCELVVKSNQGAQNVSLKASLFRSTAALAGRVYLDFNKNRSFDTGVDKPLKGARVVLANGRNVITDADGRYMFTELSEGVWALRLDPFSAPYKPYSMPEDKGLLGSRELYVHAPLTNADFPLETPEGKIEAFRKTRLEYGSDQIGFVVLEKVVSYQGNNEYAVTIKLVVPQDRKEFTLLDDLPKGAELISGNLSPSYELLQKGEYFLDYRFRYSGVLGSALVDPNVRWRYP